MEADGFILPVVEAHCAYRQSARYDEELDIRTHGLTLSPVRLRFEYQVLRAADNTLVAEGHTVHASLGSQGRPRRLPERVLNMLPRGK